MITILIALLVVGCSSYLGWGIGNYYKKRVKFFRDVKDMLNYLINNINFYKDSVNYNLEKFINQYKPNTTLIEIVNDYKDKKIKSYALLKNDEIHLVNNIFEHLGKSDSENQIMGLKNFSFQVDELINKCDEDYNKIGKISNKLGTLLGITLAVFFI